MFFIIFYFLHLFLHSYEAGKITPCGEKPIALGYNNQAQLSSYTFSFYTQTDLFSGKCFFFKQMKHLYIEKNSHKLNLF